MGIKMKTFYDLIDFRNLSALEVAVVVNKKKLYNSIIYNFKEKWQYLIAKAKWLPATQFILKRGYLKHIK